MNDAHEILKRIDTLDEKIDRLDHHITGNGTPERGLIARVMIVEQRQKSWQWAFGIGLGVLATVAGGLIVAVVIRAIESGAK